ncbi:unnamed protein product [Parajaminaea phylloscopi]
MAEEREKTKASLKAWWSSFTKAKLPGKDKKAAAEDAKVFAVPLRKSLKYASVAISMADEEGKQYVWGYVPVIVAKVGLYLKENAVDTEGVFRIAGSQKRMRELQETFDSPPRYGKDVDWSKYSVHDAASVLRRYLNQMPEPIIPLHLYNEFRNIITKQPFDAGAAIVTYRLLITSSPPANQYLLLYVLDLLAVFARESDKNLMPASNLAVIFQPGMFSHPTHLNSAEEHRRAVEVLEFLIEHQDHFVLGLSHPPPANVSPADLTAASQPTAPEEVYFEPSDSDEDLGVLEAHEGGGSLLARRATSAQQQQRPSSSNGAGKRRLFTGRSKNAPSAAPMQLSQSQQSVETSRIDNEKLQSQVIVQRGASPLGKELSTAVEKPGPSSASQAGLKRSKTTPTRRKAPPTKGRHSDAVPSAVSNKGRRRSDDSSAASSPPTSPPIGLATRKPLQVPEGQSTDTAASGSGASAPPLAATMTPDTAVHVSS